MKIRESELDDRFVDRVAAYLAKAPPGQAAVAWTASYLTHLDESSDPPVPEVEGWPEDAPPPLLSELFYLELLGSDPAGFTDDDEYLRHLDNVAKVDSSSAFRAALRNLQAVDPSIALHVGLLAPAQKPIPTAEQAQAEAANIEALCQLVEVLHSATATGLTVSPAVWTALVTDSALDAEIVMAMRTALRCLRWHFWSVTGAGRPTRVRPGSRGCLPNIRHQAFLAALAALGVSQTARAHRAVELRMTDAATGEHVGRAERDRKARRNK